MQSKLLEVLHVARMLRDTNLVLMERILMVLCVLLIIIGLGIDSSGANFINADIFNRGIFDVSIHTSVK